MTDVIRIAYHTLGCKVNQYETEKTREALERAGFETVPFSSPADAYVINTCSVTSVADSKSRAAVRRALRLNPDAYVVVAGCYAEIEPDAIRAIEGVDLVVPNAEKDAIAERIVARFTPHPDPLPQGERELVPAPHVPTPHPNPLPQGERELVPVPHVPTPHPSPLPQGERELAPVPHVPTPDPNPLPQGERELVPVLHVPTPDPNPLPQGERELAPVPHVPTPDPNPLPQGERELVPVPHVPTPHPNPLPQGERELVPVLRVRTRAVVKVQDGCDQFCTYCIVAHARNRKWSRPVADVLAEIRALAEFAYKEIVLTGIRLGSYELRVTSYELGEGTRAANGLAELIGKVAEIDGIKRIRLSSIEPWEVDESLLDAMDSPKVCRHLHIPMQSGDDGTLHRMNRPYTTAQYLATVQRVRERIPRIGITTDVIVGFPGESEAAFENTRRMIDEVGFSRLHVFRYSARSRTPAASMPDQVPAEVKKQRAEKLIELGTTAVQRFASSLVGETLDVLVETQAKQSHNMVGFTDNYVETRFPGDAALKGEIVRVRIVGVDGEQAIGSRQ